MNQTGPLRSMGVTCALVGTLVSACGGAVDLGLPAEVEADEPLAVGYWEDVLAPVAAIPECTIGVPSSLTANPSGEFANTLIRGVPPDSHFAGNTWAAVSEADALGYRYVEVDVRISVDGHFIPARIDSLGAFTDCAGSLAASTLAELAACHYAAGASTPVLTLEEAVAGADFHAVYLDLKCTSSPPFATPEQVVEATSALALAIGKLGAVVGMSYRKDAAEALLAAGFRAGLKGYPAGTDEILAMIESAAAIGAEMTCLRTTILGSKAWDLSRELGVWQLPWAAAGDVEPDMLQEMILRSAGGLINPDPAGLEEMIAQLCF